MRRLPSRLLWTLYNTTHVFLQHQFRRNYVQSLYPVALDSQGQKVLARQQEKWYFCNERNLIMSVNPFSCELIHSGCKYSLQTLVVPNDIIHFILNLLGSYKYTLHSCFSSYIMWTYLSTGGFCKVFPWADLAGCACQIVKRTSIFALLDLASDYTASLAGVLNNESVDIIKFF